VHHGGAGCEVGAETDPVGVGDAHARRHHVVDHAGELVEPVDGQVPAGGPLRGAQFVDLVGRARPGRRPRDVGQDAEDAVHVGLVRLDDAVREQVQPQVRVEGVGGRVGERPDDHELRRRRGAGGRCGGLCLRRRGAEAEASARVPGVEDLSVGRDGGLG
jgi:hypothetical protein